LSGLGKMNREMGWIEAGIFPKVEPSK